MRTSRADHRVEARHPVTTFEVMVNMLDEKFITYFREGRGSYQPGGYSPDVGDISRPEGLAATLRGGGPPSGAGHGHERAFRRSAY